MIQLLIPGSAGKAASTAGPHSTTSGQHLPEATDLSNQSDKASGLVRPNPTITKRHPSMAAGMQDIASGLHLIGTGIPEMPSDPYTVISGTDALETAGSARI
jgi:hypothetical protein